MFDWLRKLCSALHRRKQQPSVEHDPIELVQEAHEPIKLNRQKEPIIHDTPHTNSEPYSRTFIFEIEKETAERKLRLHQAMKEIKISAIREANIQRQHNTLGHGLRGKFKPRPAYEKKMWKLDKKPEED